MFASKIHQSKIQGPGGGSFRRRTAAGAGAGAVIETGAGASGSGIGAGFGFVDGLLQDAALRLVLLAMRRALRLGRLRGGSQARHVPLRLRVLQPRLQRRALLRALLRL